MTISMDHRSHRKNSWDSKMSISTTNSEPRRCRRGTPSSIISSDSDIRFTRKKLSSQTRCGCCIVAILLLLLLLAAATVYVGYTYLLPETPTEQIFRGTFRVVNGDSFSPELADPNNNKFKERSRDYRERINLLFRKSSLNYLFVGSEILALDGTEDKDLIVHFNILMDPYETVDAKELENAIASEIAAEQSLYFKNLTIDATSLEIKPGHMLPQPSTTTFATTIVSEAVTQTPAPPRRCYPLQLEYCKRLMYNVTTYPNVLEHRSLSDVNEDMITFRELVDAECYKYAYEFVCQLLQPGCLRGEDEDGIIKPCRSFCRDFMAGCGSRLSGKFKEMLDCSRFPEYEGEMSCFTKPNCAAELQQRALSPRLCDGVADCEDLSDEKSCAYCPAGQMYCGIGRTCIPNESRCDGKHDCPDGADERACLTLVPDVESLKKSSKLTPHQRKYYSEGFVAFNERGQVGKLCTENLNRSLSVNQSTAVLQTVASSLCKTLTYQNFLSATVEKDSEPNVPYVKMKNPTASEISFVRTKCRSHQVLKVKCSTLECGLQITHGPEGLQALNKMSAHGDWPWHAALFKEDVHICDGTLLSPDWVATTISCFQGQPKAEWTARFGSVRLMSTSPWDQERTIVGMIKSPVEGSTIALVRLDQPVVLNDFVRPICLPKENTIISSQTDCNTLGWARNREQLQRVQIKQISMEKCENISISNVNGLCTETMHGQNDCNEEEFAGSPMMCQNEDNENWMLVGVSNWRIACSKSGMERPRMYDKISSNINWIQEAINSNET